MQQQNETFSERTENLARTLGLTLRDLGSRIEISPAMLFAYRSGKREVTRKAWKKLESAESEAGLSTKLTLRKSEADDTGSILTDLRDCIDQAHNAEALISTLKQSLEKLIKKL